MKNFVQPGKTLSFVAAADIASGAGILLGTLLGVSAGDYKNGETGEAVVEGVFKLKKAAVTNNLWATAYWDDTAKVITNTSNSNANKAVGVFAEVTGASVDVAVLLVPSAT